MQRDSEEARKSGQRGSLERSEGEGRPAKRGGHQPEAEGKRASGLAALQRDSEEARRRAEQRAKAGAEQKQGDPKGRRAFAEAEELEPRRAAAAA